MRVTDRTLEIACRINGPDNPTENTIRDLAMDLRDARQHIRALADLIRDAVPVLSEHADLSERAHALLTSETDWPSEILPCPNCGTRSPVHATDCPTSSDDSGG